MEKFVLIFKDPRPYVLDVKKLRSTNNVPFVSSLFYELARSRAYKNALTKENVNFPTFTLDTEFDIYYDACNSNPEHYYWSMRRLYLEANDPNEYEFAKSILGSWDHWKKLQENPKILSRINEWREELQMSLASEGCKSLISKAKDGDVQAAKFIATNKYRDIYERVKTKTDHFNEINDDYERIRLVHSNASVPRAKGA